MRQFFLLLTLLLMGPLRAEPGNEPKPERIRMLINHLGDGDFTTREEAVRELESIGEPALPAVRQAMVSADVEVRQRAKLLEAAIIRGASKSRSSGLEMKLVRGGEFQMGSPTNEAGRRLDEKSHRVKLTELFLLGKYEVTQEEYQKLMKVNPSSHSETGAVKAKVAKMDTKRFPVECVTWFDAIEFCNRLSETDGYKPYYKLADVKKAADTITVATPTVLGGNGYRLPTEAEWEYACRGGTTTRFHFGVASNGKQANFKAYISSGGYGGPEEWAQLERTCTVGSYPANRFGLFDMHGNVGEWCWDYYDKDSANAELVINPKGPEEGNHRMIRGGSWLIADSSCRSASRFWHTPDEAKDYSGFRVARTP